MKKRYLKTALVVASIFAIVIFLKKEQADESIILNSKEGYELQTSGAGKSMDNWYFERAYPNETIQTKDYMHAYENKKLIRLNSNNRSQNMDEDWESLGPINIGGRMLSLAFHPTNPDIVFAGSASGGLWKTTTRGVGQNAWEYVPTGFPVLGVSSIAIDQNNPDVMYLGTGETYAVGIAEPGIINRVTRGTYGIGILKTTDGGTTWNQSLSYTESAIKGINDVVISPTNSQEIFAATTDGVYRSLDGGGNWSLTFSNLNCRDIEVDPNNGNIVYVTQGNLNTGQNPNFCGIFKSTDKGLTFTELLDPGLDSTWSGIATITIDPSNSSILYVLAHDAFANAGPNPVTPAGLFRSDDGGTTWSEINTQNMGSFQGWYCNDLAINPDNTSEMIALGILVWKSNDSGNSFQAKSSGGQIFGEINVDETEGGPGYLHSDVHAVAYHPLVPNTIFFASDGGISVSEDGGETFTTRNGGLVTSQFYANIASSATDPNFVIGGTQDNSTFINRGEPSWTRVIGGDGMTAAVHKDNDQIIFGSAQNMIMRKSTDQGLNFFDITPENITDFNFFPAFSAPYELAPSNNDIMYAGATFIYKSTDAGDTWVKANQQADGFNRILKIAIATSDDDIIYISTGPDPFFGSGTPKVMKSIDGGQTFTQLSGLPNRICKDIEIDPTDDNIVYTLFSGFGTNHVYKSIDAGLTWSSIDNGLPDLPTNTILIDPLNPDDLYIGNDLGVYYSADGGSSWQDCNDGLPEATMVLDLNESPSNRKVRIATHGHGIYQRDFVKNAISSTDFPENSFSINMYPNPASEYFTITINNNNLIDNVIVSLYNVQGQELVVLFDGSLNLGENNIIVDNLDPLSNGIYIVEISSKNFKTSRRIVVN